MSGMRISCEGLFQCLHHSLLNFPRKFSDMKVYNILVLKYTTVKPVLSGHLKRRPKLFFKTDYHLMQVKSIAECSPWGILQYFRPSLSYHLPLRPLFCLFLSGRLRQVLLYSAHCTINLAIVLYGSVHPHRTLRFIFWHEDTTAYHPTRIFV